MKNVNTKVVLAAVISTMLTACGGGGIGTQLSSAVPATSLEPVAKSFATVTPMTSVDYQQVRQLAGTGYGMTISPTDMRTHYSFPATSTGAGQTIAVVNAPGSVYGAAILTDLNTFNTYYKLPLCNTANPCFKQIDLSAGAKGFFEFRVAYAA